MNGRNISVLRRRIFSASLLLTLVAVVSIGGFLSRTFSHIFMSFTEDSLRNQAVLVAHTLKGEMNGSQSSAVSDALEGLGSGFTSRITVIDKEGTVIADTVGDVSSMENHLSRVEFVRALSGHTGVRTHLSRTLDVRMLYVAVPVTWEGHVIGAVRAARSIKSLEDATRGIRVTMIILFIIVLLVISWLSYFLSGRITRPVTALSEAAIQLAQGNYSAQVKVEGDGEMAALAKSFNYMGRTVATSIELLSTEKKRIEAILSNLAEGVLVTDSQGVVSLVNKAAVRMFGFSLDDVIGKPVISAFINYEVDRGVLETLVNNQPLESEFILSNPKKLVLRLYSVPLTDNDGQVTGTLVVFQDISKIKHLEQIRQDFVANVSHELRTPITSIKAMAETLLDGALDDASVASRFLSTINSEADRLTRLVDDLLQLARIEQKSLSVVPEEFSVPSLIEETLLQLQRKAEAMEVTLINRCEPGLKLFAMRDRIHQVLVNLIDNAVMYSGKGSTVCVEAYNSSTGHCVIAVEDNGVGIPSRDLSRIFERFYRVDKARSRQVGGTGLGLSIVKHIVEIHGGTISVKSEEGLGTRFEVWLPFPS